MRPYKTLFFFFFFKFPPCVFAFHNLWKWFSTDVSKHATTLSLQTISDGCVKNPRIIVTQQRFHIVQHSSKHVSYKKMICLSAFVTDATSDV